MVYNLINSPSAQELSELSQRFREYIIARAAIPDETRDKKFLISARDSSERLVAGISANAYWDGLEIDTLWVDQNFRSEGLGADLLKRAEQYGRQQGAVISFLKTVDAKEFYEKSGYQVYGILEDHPIGSLLYHMKNRLDYESM